MLFNEYAKALVENIHTLEDNEVTALFTALMVEMDRRFIDIDDAFEEGQEVIEHQYDDEEEEEISAGEFEELCARAYDNADQQGWL